VPDILCLSKGLTGGAIPLAVTMASEPVYAAHLSTDRAKMFFHSSSYTANPIACAAANANLAIWRDEPVLDRVKRLETRLSERVDALAGKRAIRNARVSGGIAALELGEGDGYLAGDVPAMMRHCLDRGVLLRPLGSTIYTMPPYCITEEQLDAVFDAIATI
jgi:adenosylmethionine---8-amino-7-oxononanoate aminotransferase